MLLFLATVLEQLDLALEHISKRDIHNARFGLMLTDNAIELVLHQIAKDEERNLKSFSYLRKNYPHGRALEKALQRSFDAKLKFARLLGRVTEESQLTIAIMHGFRNEVYHVGLQHESILPAIAVFYFDTICRTLEKYDPRGLGWGSNQKLPERAKKYFHGPDFFPGEAGDFQKGCATLVSACAHNIAETITVLADHIDEVVADQDTCIGIVSDGVYVGQQRTRDKAVIETQAWKLAFSEDAKKYAQSRKWGGGNMLQFVDWLAEEFPFKVRRDPIPSWEKRAQTLRAETNAHAALARYHSFMTETAALREALMESAAAAEAEIDAAIDRARGK